MLQPGETLEVCVGSGHKGPHVTEVLSVNSSTAAPATRRSSPPRTASNSPLDVSAEQSGIVKWFNADKSCGFIALADREQDVFVHISVLERSGLIGLAEGQQVVVDVGEGRKGPEAVKVRLI